MPMHKVERAMILTLIFVVVISVLMVLAATLLDVVGHTAILGNAQMTRTDIVG